MWARFSPRSGGDKFGVRNVTSVVNEIRQILWPDGDDAISAIDAICGEYFKQGLSLAALMDLRCSLIITPRVIGRPAVLCKYEDTKAKIKVIIIVKIYEFSDNYFSALIPVAAFHLD